MKLKYQKERGERGSKKGKVLLLLLFSSSKGSWREDENVNLIQFFIIIFLSSSHSLSRRLGWCLMFSSLFLSLAGGGRVSPVEFPGAFLLSILFTTSWLLMRKSGLGLLWSYLWTDQRITTKINVISIY
jgi:hypothetical protein